MSCVFLRRFGGFWIEESTRILGLGEVRRGPSFVRLDGDCGLGLVVSVYAMKEAVALASQSRAGVAAVFNSDHFGAAAYYAMLALKHHMIGVAMTNAATVMALWLLTLTMLRTPLPI